MRAQKGFQLQSNQIQRREKKRNGDLPLIMQFAFALFAISWLRGGCAVTAHA